MSDNQEILNISELYDYNDEDIPDSANPILYVLCQYRDKELD